MAKRFHDTDIWTQDWFIKIDFEYMLLWFYILDTCDHAGIWKPNTWIIEQIVKKPIDLQKALTLFNNGKDRIVVLKNNRWLITDFIVFQYGKTLNPLNRMHNSVLRLLKVNEVNLTSIRGLLDSIDRVKDKEKEIKNKELNSSIKVNTYNTNIGYSPKNGLSSELRARAEELAKNRGVK